MVLHFIIIPGRLGGVYRILRYKSGSAMFKANTLPIALSPYSHSQIPFQNNKEVAEFNVVINTV